MKTGCIILSLPNLASGLTSSMAISSVPLAQYFKIWEDTSVYVSPAQRCLAFWMLTNASTMARICLTRVMLWAKHKEKKAGSVRRLTCMWDVHQKQEAWSHSEHLEWQLTAAIRDYKKVMVQTEAFVPIIWTKNIESEVLVCGPAMGGLSGEGHIIKSGCAVIRGSSLSAHISSSEIWSRFH